MIHAARGEAPKPVEKGACLLCKTQAWVPLTLLMGGSEKAVFECTSCGLFYKAKPNEMQYWERLAGRSSHKVVVESNNLTLEPQFYRPGLGT